MHFYEKRIAFVIGSKYLLPHCGLGSFTKSFIDMSSRLNWKVDIIVDNKPKQNLLLEFLKQYDNCSIIYSDERLNYTKNNSLFSFTKSLNLEYMINIRSSIERAITTRIYDLIMINDPESILPIYLTNIPKYIPTLIYTHLSETIYFDIKSTSGMLESACKVIESFVRLDDVIIATQSENNKKILLEHGDFNCCVLPMIISEPELSQEAENEKDGVLFIGRYDTNKNPKFFCDIVSRTGLKAKILTSSNGEIKFKKYFDKIGYSNYEIKSNIIGKEKIDFIKSAKVAFHPSKIETFGFSAFETLYSCKTFCLSEYSWNKHFGDLVHLTTKKNAERDIIAAHYEDYDLNEIIKKLTTYQINSESKWKSF